FKASSSFSFFVFPELVFIMPVPESWQPLLSHPCCTTPAKLAKWKKKFFLPSYSVTRLPRPDQFPFSNRSDEITVFPSPTEGRTSVSSTEDDL
ncbi:hypothetical protein, partial [Escherichia coli]|uniref:hypothetical protein n=1 Tax=Escherichia coli TaxID=562 RepID=UPI00200C9512